MSQGDRALLLEVSPLVQMSYTGISWVAWEITSRFLISDSIPVIFSSNNVIIPKSVIIETTLARCGAPLVKFIDSAEGLPIETAGYDCVALFTNIKTTTQRFAIELQVIYDLSFMLVPEFHAQETVRHHSAGLVEHIKRCETVFCISESVKEHLSFYLGVPKAKIETLPLGADFDFEFIEASRLRINGLARGVERYILVLGTIEPRKNIRIIFRFLSRFPFFLNSYRFIFVGAQGWDVPFDEIIREYSLDFFQSNGRLKYLGYVSQETKLVLLDNASALLYPSFFEGFGLPLVEAMALGTPVISSCATSLPEVAGEFAYYFRPESMDDLHSAFLAFERDVSSGQINRVVDGARDRVSLFSYDIVFDILMRVAKSHLS